MDQPCALQVVRISGTIKKVEGEAIRRARNVIRRTQNHAGHQSTNLTARQVTAQPPLDDEEDDLGMSNGIEDLDEPGDVYEESEDNG